MRVLVTGATGFTGSALVRRLLADGHEVVGLDNQEGLFFGELKGLGADLRIGSVTDAEAVRGATSGCEVVHHLAAAFRRLDVPDSVYWDANVEGTRNVCRACMETGVRKLMYCSTQGVHGHVKTPPGDERSPIEPADYYQLTKYEGEKVVLEYVERGLDAVIVRPTAIYGPGDPARFLHLFRLARKGTFNMFGDGLTTYHPVYIDNLVDCFLLAVETQGNAGQAYIGGDAEYFTLNDLVTRVGRAIGVEVKIRHLPFWPLYGAALGCEVVCKPLRISPPLFRRRVDWFRQVRAFTIEKARRELGYEPRVGIDEGLRRTGAWYIENGYLENGVRS